MGYINAAKQELFYLAVSINASKGEFFKLSNTIECAKTETFTLAKALNCAVDEQFQLVSEAVIAQEQGTVIDGAEWINFVAPICIPHARLNGENLDDFIVSSTLKKHLGGKTMLTLKLVQPSVVVGAATLEQLLKLQPSSINPWAVGFADSSGRLIRHNFTRRTVLKFSYDWGYDQYGYQNYIAPYFLPLEPKFNGRELEWELEDFTGLFERQNISLTDIDADAPEGAAGIQRGATAHSNIRELCTWAGISSVQINYPDWNIRLLRRKNGVPLNWIDQTNRVRQAKRRWFGSSFIHELTTPPHLGNAKWVFKGGQHIEEGSFQAYQDLSDYKNKFDVSRTAPQGGIIGEQECIGGQCIGRTGNIVFDLPVTSCAATVEVTNGEIQDFVYFTPGNQPTLSDSAYALGPSGSAYIGPTAARVEFTYRGRIGQEEGGGLGGIGGATYSSSIIGSNASLVSYLPRYKVTYYGKLDSQVSINPVYSYTAQDSGQISIFGEWPEYGVIEDPMIADYATMVAYGQALLQEATRKMWWVRFRTPYVNPKVEPGHIFRVDDYSTQINHNWLVEEMSITTENGTSVMEILGSRGGV